MATFWVDQLRPLLVVWLLLTTPLVCHHATAEVVLGSLVAPVSALPGRLSAHAWHEPSRAHAHHQPAVDASAQSLLGTPLVREGAALDAAPRYTAESAGRVHFLPAGQDNFALMSLHPLPHRASDSSPVDLQTAHPPPDYTPLPAAPPPRLAV